MMGLSDSERISMIHSAALIQITRVTDGRTDGIRVAYTRYAVARKFFLPAAKASSGGATPGRACRMTRLS